MDCIQVYNCKKTWHFGQAVKKVKIRVQQRFENNGYHNNMVDLLKKMRMANPA